MTNKLYITNFYPNSYSGGFAISCYEKIKNDILVNKSSKIFVYVILDDHTQGRIEDAVSFTIFESSKVIVNNFNPLRSYKILNNEIRELQEKYLFDEVIIFGEKALYAFDTKYITNNVVLYLGDPYPKVALLRFKYHLKYVLNFRVNRSTFNYFLKVLWIYLDFVLYCRKNSCFITKMFFYGHQHRFFWNRICGFKNCLLNMTSIESIYEEGRSSLRNNNVLIMGKLDQIENLYSQYFLVYKFFPVFLKNKFSSSINIFILGNINGALNSLKEIVDDNSNVKFLGFVENIDQYWYTSKILLVTTTTYLGVRTRIFSAFSKGCIVICHFSCKASIPQLEDGENCIICSTGQEFTNSIMKVSNDDSLFYKLQNGGYETLKNLMNYES
jgi:hypothetical protein